MLIKICGHGLKLGKCLQEIVGVAALLAPSRPISPPFRCKVGESKFCFVFLLGSPNGSQSKKEELASDFEEHALNYCRGRKCKTRLSRTKLTTSNLFRNPTWASNYTNTETIMHGRRNNKKSKRGDNPSSTLLSCCLWTAALRKQEPGRVTTKKQNTSMGA